MIDRSARVPQLKGLKGNPRQTVFIHYDQNPTVQKPKFRRVRFPFDGRFKLYLEGGFFDMPQDWNEQNPLQPDQLMGPADRSFQSSRGGLIRWSLGSQTSPSSRDGRIVKR